MTRNIVLIGLMGSGKSTVGKLIAEQLGKVFIDTDDLIEKDTQKSINEIFATDGEAYFRKLEAKIIEKVSLNPDQIISTGGGAVENPENIKNLKRNGLVFYLKASSQELYERVKNEKNRPLLQNNNPLETLERLLDKREKFYSLADFIINTDRKNPEEIAREIGEKYINYEN